MEQVAIGLRAGPELTEPTFLERVFKRWKRQISLSAEDRRAVEDLPWTMKHYDREAYLVREGQQATVCSVLISGLTYRQKLISDGGRQIISFHIPGEFLDIQNCLLEVADHNVQSLGRSTVAIIPKGALLELMGSRPKVARAIWYDSLVDASIFREWVVNVGRRDARERIAHLLCELAARIQKAGICDGPSFDFPITQEQLADATGLTAVHTNRTLQSLRKDGLITLSSSKLTILDWRALAEVGDFNARYLHETG